MSIEEKIISILDNIRPYLVSDGGDISFVKYSDGYVYVKMQGACAQCEMIDFTLDDSIECILKDEIPDIKGVINVK